MQPQCPQIAMFRELLSRFLAVSAIDDAGVNLAYAHLFNDPEGLPALRHPQLASTIHYLAEIITMHELQTLEDLINHYEDQKKKISSFLKVLMTPGHEKKLVINACAGAGKTGPFTQLVRQSQPKKNRVICDTNSLQQLINSLYQDLNTFCVDIAVAPVAGSGSFMPYDHREVTLKDVIRDRRQHFSKVYLEQFSGQNSKLYYTATIKLPNGTGKSRSFAKKLYARERKNSLNSHAYNFFSRVIEQGYQQLLNVMRNEEPISDRQIKAKLAEWLYYSKFRNTDLVKIFLHGPESLRDWGFDPDDKSDSECDALQLNQQLMAIIRKVYETKLSLKKWVILKSPPGHSWLTSDNPGFSINLREPGSNRQKSVPDPVLATGNIRRDTVVYYPLSKEYCLRLQPYDTYDTPLDEVKHMPITFELSTEKELDVVNRLTYSTPYQLVITGDKKAIDLCRKPVAGQVPGGI
ncbi:Protein of unknown function [Chitinophaga rupis]|uniref:Uncharacterized protein n=1 Tax=Chitinophaga rupis TaxID=573321 RepID=A0A1H7RVX8_9BACT|nr:DUF4238 domain-containing protein [Chitinophaga rupis]SEL64179.1 Protein of unknown function [Chitinophaga rupis]